MRHFSTVNAKKLLQPFKLGPFELQNRIVMAAMTRCRADAKTGIPSDMHVKYYSERSENTGLVLTECSSISNNGNSFPGAAGIWTDEQAEGWKRVTDAVHQKNGKIYLQIWHGGRASRKATTKEVPLAPSAVPIRSPAKNDLGYVHLDMPEELTEDGIKRIVEEFSKGAKRAKKAGFDGLELHGGNGYLIDQFLRDGTNQRTDKYGGSFENRSRFPLMVIDALNEVYGADKVGIKLSPVGRYGDMFDSNPAELYKYFLEELSKKKISFVELMRGPDTLPGKDFSGVKGEDQIPDVFKALRPSFKGAIIGNNKIRFEESNSLIEKGDVDLVSFAQPFIANPDLVKRFENGWKLAEYNQKTVYFGKTEGYCDYPKYDASA